MTDVKTADRELQTIDLLGDQAVVDELIELIVDHAELLRLLDIEVRAVVRILPEVLYLCANCRGELFATYLRVADSRDRRVDGTIAEPAPDTPEAEGDDQHREEDLRDEGTGS